MQTTRKLIVLLLLVLVCAASPVACPISPPLPLRSLTAASDLIVTAKLGRVLAQVKGARIMLVPVQMHIAQVLKGDLREQTVNVWLWPFQLEQLPPNTDLLVFLKATSQGDDYIPVGERGEGIKNLSAKALEVYRAQLNALLEIERLTDPINRQQQGVDWLVRCVEEPITRWEGAYDLAYGEIATDGVENSKRQYRAFKDLLNDEQKQRLSRTLYETARIREGELALLALIEQWGDENLVPFLWSYLKAGRQDEPYIISQLIRRIAEAVAAPEVDELIDQYESALAGTDDEEKPQPPIDSAQALDAFFKRIESYGAPRLVVIKAEER